MRSCPSIRKRRPPKHSVFAAAAALASFAWRGSVGAVKTLPAESLWGTNGELFNPSYRLLDWSYAGYNAGEAPIPTLVPTHNIKNFNANGDGSVDDSPAFMAAISAMAKKDVLWVPAGTMDSQVLISKRISILGEGSGKVTIVYTRAAMAPNPDPFGNNAVFSYQGAAFYSDATKITTVKPTGKRGSNTIAVTSTTGVAVGIWVALTMAAPAGVDPSRWASMNMGAAGCNDYCTGRYAFAHISRVASVDTAANTVVLERPLPWSLFNTFTPQELHRIRPAIANIGVEGLKILCVSGRYVKHLEEKGFNGIELINVFNSWVRDVVIDNSDIGINVLGSAFVTVTATQINGYGDDRRMVELQHIGSLTGTFIVDMSCECVLFICADDRRMVELDHGVPVWGHHALWVGHNSTSVLFEDFNINTTYVHDLSVDEYADSVVFSRGKGSNINMDHHMAQNYGTLWTEVNIGSQGLGGLDNNFGPYMNFVNIGKPSSAYPTGGLTSNWAVDPSERPVNLYQAQRAVRLANPTKVSKRLGGKGSGGKLLSVY
ncbi:hypothetical protein JKP88DRAFT_245650 [Tribonema minus]|uniref:Rhamnogalacturonase A/B/Epimerase-like pectate lyase domain-containing protein n=1 Tax=Tribonema minus TaxID=303371 RepID=A0A836CEH2_9STRA|nr:hypothetical protein JKP88DRAFT_245650 [Tribonema minus]